MRARLIYEGRDSIELETPSTIVGRMTPDLMPPEPSDAAAGPAVARASDITTRLVDGKTLVAVLDMRLARRHFEICRQDSPEGRARYLVRDLDSHCGTSINGCHVGPGWHELHDGDAVLYEVFRFRCEP